MGGDFWWRRGTPTSLPEHSSFALNSQSASAACHHRSDTNQPICGYSTKGFPHCYKHSPHWKRINLRRWGAAELPWLRYPMNSPVNTTACVTKHNSVCTYTNSLHNLGNKAINRRSRHLCIFVTGLTGDGFPPKHVVNFCKNRTVITKLFFLLNCGTTVNLLIELFWTPKSAQLTKKLSHRKTHLGRYN